MTNFFQKIRVRPSAALIGFLILSGGGKEALWSLFAALLHEAGHLAAMRLAGASVRRVTVGALGIDIERAAGLTSYRSDLLIYAGGAAANLLSAGIAAALRLPGGFLLASLAHAAFSLLPVPILDGGGMLRSALCLFLREERAKTVCFLCGLTVYVPLLSLSLYLLWEKGENVTLLLLCAALGYSLFSDSEQGR